MSKAESGWRWLSGTMAADILGAAGSVEGNRRFWFAGLCVAIIEPSSVEKFSEAGGTGPHAWTIFSWSSGDSLAK